jgi:hypothetical protein
MRRRSKRSAIAGWRVITGAAGDPAARITACVRTINLSARKR